MTDDDDNPRSADLRAWIAQANPDARVVVCEPVGKDRVAFGAAVRATDTGEVKRLAFVMTRERAWEIAVRLLEATGATEARFRDDGWLIKGAWKVEG